MDSCKKLEVLHIQKTRQYIFSILMSHILNIQTAYSSIESLHLQPYVNRTHFVENNKESQKKKKMNFHSFSGASAKMFCKDWTHVLYMKWRFTKIIARILRHLLVESKIETLYKYLYLYIQKYKWNYNRKILWTRKACCQ